MKGVESANIDCPPGFHELLDSAYRLEKILNKTRAPKGFCHNDLVPQKFIKCEDGMRLVEFDYAGIGWIAVDLASATSQFEMTENEIESFLLSYDDGLDDGQRGRLAALRFCNNIREVSYTLFAEPLLSDTTATLDDLSYATHREFNLEQAQDACSDPTFDDKCKAATSVRQEALF